MKTPKLCETCPLTEFALKYGLEVRVVKVKKLRLKRDALDSEQTMNAFRSACRQAKATTGEKNQDLRIKLKDIGDLMEKELGARPTSYWIGNQARQRGFPVATIGGRTFISCNLAFRRFIGKIRTPMKAN